MNTDYADTTDDRRFAKVVRKIEELINKDKDRLFMSPLCRQCFSNKMTSGQKMEIEDKLVVC